MLNIHLVGLHWNSQYRVQRYVGAHEGGSLKTKINLSQRQKKTPKLQEQSYLRYGAFLQRRNALASKHQRA